MPRPSKPLPPLDTLREFFRYDPDTGEFSRVRRMGNTTRNPRGVYQHTNGYEKVYLNKKLYYVHRIAWALGHNRLPEPHETVDHINGDRADQRLANLRLATHREQRCNVARSQSRKYDLPKNVNPAGGGFQVKIDGQAWGTFPKVEEAEEQARFVRSMLHGAFANHG